MAYPVPCAAYRFWSDSGEVGEVQPASDPRGADADPSRGAVGQSQRAIDLGAPGIQMPESTAVQGQRAQFRLTDVDAVVQPTALQAQGCT